MTAIQQDRQKRYETILTRMEAHKLKKNDSREWHTKETELEDTRHKSHSASRSNGHSKDLHHCVLSRTPTRWSSSILLAPGSEAGPINGLLIDASSEPYHDLSAFYRIVYSQKTNR
eukprot:Blabericola_migrator_1__9577@NODE_5220_length_840_cov_18_781371_g3331_i0_p1_GENE_NODE_5220_length_840_cov_18_781371_g3331_i0NODE_5220_length_840_cov_18_781371_g3331_i0_p1_ORF_typecomplete_len116_score8_08_NODE_5220_length_840_cov_18_781371_g3331_i0186533